MKVLHLIDGFHIGGAEKLLSQYVIYEKQNKEIEHEICTLYNIESFILKQLYREKIKINSLNCKFKFDFTKVRLLIKHIRKENIDIVHVHLFPALYFAAIASLFLKDVKFIYTEHSVANKRRKYNIFKFIESFIYKRYEKVICCSESVKNSLIKWVPAIDKRSVIINNAIQNSFIGTSEKIYDFILVGSMRSNVKGFDIFLNALKEIVNDVNKVAILGDGIIIDDLKSQSHKLQLDNIVEFLGNREDVNYYLSMSKCFILSSRWEGLPLALLEAMSNGLPCVCTAVGEIPNIINNNKNGILVEPNNEEALSLAMKEILKFNTLSKKIGDAAKKTFEENYTMDVYSNNIKKIYNELIIER